MFWLGNKFRWMRGHIFETHRDDKFPQGQTKSMHAHTWLKHALQRVCDTEASSALQATTSNPRVLHVTVCIIIRKSVYVSVCHGNPSTPVLIS